MHNNITATMSVNRWFYPMQLFKHKSSIKYVGHEGIKPTNGVASTTLQPKNNPVYQKYIEAASLSNRAFMEKLKIKMESRIIYISDHILCGSVIISRKDGSRVGRNIAREHLLSILYERSKKCF